MVVGLRRLAVQVVATVVSVSVENPSGKVPSSWKKDFSQRAGVHPEQTESLS